MVGERKLTGRFEEPALAGLYDEVSRSRERVEEELGQLRPEQLSWSPGGDRWCVAQCLDHLVTTDTLYLVEIERRCEEGRARGRVRRRPFRGGWFGGWFSRMVGPDVRMKVKAPKVFIPRNIEDINEAVVSRYLEIQDRLLRALGEADGLDLDRILVTSPVSRLLSFRLGDAFRIVVEHDKRHLLQASRVMRQGGFPSATTTPGGTTP